jgi:putative DNA primase/helicase
VPLNQPRFIGSANPYVGWAEKYLGAGYKPLPLPPGQKNPPPTGWTGHGRPAVDEIQMGKWLSGAEKLFWRNPAKNKSEPFDINKANIAIRLWTVTIDGKDYDLVGIDVDHHPDDKDDPKNGGPQLDSLELRLGALPPTWTSSARTNGISGIRLYLAPAGLAWRGDCGEHGRDIDIISKNYRFLVSFPSTNPDANNRQYWWYPPDFKPDGNVDGIDRDKWGFIPNPKKLPFLPDKWVNFLTNNRLPETDVAMDMDITDRRLSRWAVKHFAPNDKICDYMQRILEDWKVKLENEAKSHNVLTAAHNHMLRCGATEGHNGWLLAVKEFEKAYVSNVLDRHKRTITSAEKEIERSRFGVLRRIKGEADEFAAQKLGYFEIDDRCDNADFKVPGSNSDDGGFDYIPRNKVKDCEDYEATDWGNAAHFRDLHEGYVRNVANSSAGWLVWDGERWVWPKTDGAARGLFRRVKRRQMAEARKKRIAAVGDQAAEKAAKAYAAFAMQSGDKARITKALDLASTMPEVQIFQEQLDSDRWALACANGIVRFVEVDKRYEIQMVENTRELLLTKNTGVEYIPLAEQAKMKEYQQGYKGLGYFLKGLQPDRERREYLQKLLGQCLIGTNPHKIALFFYGPKNTGKTTLLELMLESIGDYGDTRNPSLFIPQKLNPMMGSALPMRIIGIDELGNSHVGSDLFKTITGNGTVNVEMKNSNLAISDQPQFTIIVTTNTVPRVPSEDAAFRDRLVVIPFQQMVAGKGGDPYKFRRSLDKYCLPAMLAWLVEGCQKALNESIRPFPEWVIQATGEFASQLSDFGTFIRDCVIETGNEWEFCPSRDILAAWDEYSTINNIEKKGVSTEVLAKALVSQGFTQSKKYLEKKQMRGFVGCKVKFKEQEISYDLRKLKNNRES